MSLKDPLRIVCTLLAALPFSVTLAWDVLVDIRGEIVGNTCIVSGDSTHIKVNLGTISTRQFSGVGSVSNIRQPFALSLEDCGPTFSGAKVRFTGTPDDDSPQLLQLDAGGAQGVGVQILDANGNPVPLNTWSELWSGNGDGTATLNFSARLQATRMPVEAGSATAIATWELEYQ
ncbi:type 1 fimbria pilin [Enterobacter sp. BIGb0383]|uniref:fimbrial protein n=1 Tax=unclassified Enterobacter TaxID=2608935 RepID=UPI000F4A1339|nr:MULTISPECIES: fimbrial protein [unclassified Enterobacter]ROP62872.1 type 1 fimbria pilin [Enterobacter sp. BIGb0383]ROS13033.1 type 1 fimbria pilin [Enterobacter sp. BIGb0359]